MVETNLPYLGKNNFSSSQNVEDQCLHRCRGVDFHMNFFPDFWNWSHQGQLQVIVSLTGRWHYVGYNFLQVVVGELKNKITFYLSN